MEELTTTQKLQKIQFELKAPKGQRNKFGNYNYRSCEDILESVKPLLAKYELSLTVNDNIELIGDRYYVKATATVGDISVSAYAREPNEQKGMAPAQLTGATSSYARKYCLNGLFAIDDTKDADTQDNRQQMDTKPIDQDRVGKIEAYLKKTIDADEEEEAIRAKLIAAWAKLSNDEKISVNELLKIKAEGCNKQYNTILKEYLSKGE